MAGHGVCVCEGNDSRTNVVSFQNEMGVESSRAPQRGIAPANLEASGRGASLTFLPNSLPLLYLSPAYSLPPPAPAPSCLSTRIDGRTAEVVDWECGNSARSQREAV